ncbi:MAG: IPT/TIG domain-containing protein [Planctomycetes bacterium]|nr:IPT/TIG domain-containing protein [Planctomycetota bacterium]
MVRKAVSTVGLVLLLAVAGRARGTDCGACRYYVQGGPFLAGASGQRVTLLCDNDITVYGFSFGIHHDETKLRVTAVTNAGTAAAGADYFDGSIDAARGLIGFGCILDTSGDFANKLDPGTGRSLAIMTVDVLSTTDGQAAMTFESVQIRPPPARPVKNLMTDSQGYSIVPALEHGTIVIETRVPVIEAILDNSGFAGKVFQVAGRFFAEPGRSVTVCGAAASATLRADGRTLDVTAPGCATIGCVEVKVCTVRGCDAEPEGFCYLRPPPPTIDGIAPDRGKQGTLFVVTGEGFDPRGLVVRVCGVEAAHRPPTDGNTRIEVTAPACGSSGPAGVEVCTDFGCDLAPGGFTYVTDPLPVIASIAPDEGREGTAFVIAGENFDRPGLAVRVCGKDVAHGAPRNGGTAIDVTAPTCAVGPADVEVCNDVGCTVVPGGFRYLPDPVPRILQIEPPEGRAGTKVTITGENFDQPGLAVRICGVEAVHGPPQNGGTVLETTAPACSTVGPVDVQVCNDFGCDTVAGGFGYLPAPVPAIARIEPSEGPAGTMVTITGENFDQPGLTVRICGVEAAHGPPQNGGTVVEATAPGCPTEGPVAVEVCNSFGCASDPDGYTYPPTGGTRFVRGDADASGAIDLTDGIRTLNFLFTGGRPPACDDAADTDDKGDLNITDAIRIFNWLFTGGPPPLPPSPSSPSVSPGDCGIDPTPADALECQTTSPQCGG